METTNKSRVVYKYRTFSERTLEILTSRKLYFAKAEQLNDPLDSQLDIQTEYKNVQHELTRRWSGEEFSRKSFLLFLLNSNSFRDRQSGKSISLNEALQAWIGQLGILSLSKNPSDPLLWAHYAGGHKGLCLGFDTSKLTFPGYMSTGDVEYVAAPRYRELFLSLLEELGTFVRPWEDEHGYPDEVGDRFYTKQISAITREALFVKSEKWKYEEEFRIVLGKGGLHSFDPGALREIIFGTKTKLTDINRITEVLSTSGLQHVTVRRVEHVPGTFSFKLAGYGSDTR